MSEIEALLKAYRERVGMPWDRSLAGPQRVWFTVYEPTVERRLRLHLPEFAIATTEAAHGWALVDLTTAFGRWMAGHRYRDSYFRQPERMQHALQDFGKSVAAEVQERLLAPDVDDDTVVAIAGVASLFGLTRVSALIEAVAPAVRGRLLVFFPGRHDGPNYRLLDARDGWSYLAVPISATDGK